MTLLSYNLTQANYDVESATNGNDALALATSQSFDAILLDLMLPGMDGVEVTRKLRQERIATPIIMITAKTDEFDKVFGLEIGADDYVTKPFSPREVVARLKAVLRRYQTVPDDQAANLSSEMIKIGDIVIDQSKVTVRRRGERIQLTPKEYELLLYLAKRPHQVLKRDQLLEGVWGFDYAGQTRMVDVHMSHLRDKLEPDPKNPIYIQTVRGFGYRLEAPNND